MGGGKKSVFPPLSTCQEILRGWFPPRNSNSERRPTLTKNLTKRNLNIRKHGLRIPGVGGRESSENSRLRTYPGEFRACLPGGGAPRLGHEGPGHGGLTPPLVTPSRPRHGAGPARSLFSKIRCLTVRIACSSLLNGPLVFLIFKIIGDSSEGVQFYLSPKLCIYIYFHPQSSSLFVTLIRVF